MRNKIRQILAKAASTTSEAEAQTFLAKAKELMEKHQLDAASLAGVDDPMGRSWSRQWTPGQSSEKARVHESLARYYGCQVVATWDDQTYKEVYAIIGPESARVTAEEMLDFVYDWLGKEARRLAAESGTSVGRIRTRLLNAFRMRCYRESEAIKNAKPTTAAGKNALVVLDAVEAEMKRLYPDLVYNKPRKIQVGGAAIRAAAGSVPLRRQTGGASTLRIAR